MSTISIGYNKIILVSTLLLPIKSTQLPVLPVYMNTISSCGVTAYRAWHPRLSPSIQDTYPWEMLIKLYYTGVQ